MDKQANRRRWIAALRSGEYEKGKHSMKKNNHYFDGITRHCPLGIACEIYHSDHPSKSKWIVNLPQEIESFCIGDFSNSSSTFPPDEVVEYFGMTPYRMRVIAGLNDDRDADFDMVADYIERFEE